jgi:spore coat protein U-like protein
MKKLAITLAAICFSMLAIVSEANAASVSATMSVSVQVDSGCQITTSQVIFSTYAPVGANATSPDDSASGAVTVTCTPGTTATLDLGLGNHASGAQARLANGSNFVNYSLFQDASYSVAWAPGSSMSLGSAPNTTPRTYIVYARIPAGQVAPNGAYSDVVMTTVNF